MSSQNKEKFTCSGGQIGQTTEYLPKNNPKTKTKTIIIYVDQFLPIKKGIINYPFNIN